MSQFTTAWYEAQCAKRRVKMTEAAVSPTPIRIPVKPAKRIRQSSKPLMNALETEYHAILCDKWTGFCVFPQSVRLKLGNGIWYKPDFCVWTGACVRFYEVKGPHAFRGGFENLKVAASVYRQFGFTLVWKDSDHQWQSQNVLP